MSNYKWESPIDWLDHKVRENRNNPIELVSIINTLSTLVDCDQIQDAFQSDMEQDEYLQDFSEDTDED